MEYVCLLGSVCVLFCGLLFFLNRDPFYEFKLVTQVIVIILMIFCSILVVAMILWDIQTRRRKSAQRYRAKRQTTFALVQELKKQGKPFMHLVHKLNGGKTRYDENGTVVFVPPIFWDVRDSVSNNNIDLTNEYRMMNHDTVCKAFLMTCSVGNVSQVASKNVFPNVKCSHRLNKLSRFYKMVHVTLPPLPPFLPNITALMASSNTCLTPVKFLALHSTYL